MAIRWRSAGDAVKLGCLDCGLETDVRHAKDWKAKAPKDERTNPSGAAQ